MNMTESSVGSAAPPRAGVAVLPSVVTSILALFSIEQREAIRESAIRILCCGDARGHRRAIGRAVRDAAAGLAGREPEQSRVDRHALRTGDRGGRARIRAQARRALACADSCAFLRRAFL